MLEGVFNYLEEHCPETVEFLKDLTKEDLIVLVTGFAAAGLYSTDDEELLEDLVFFIDKVKQDPLNVNE